MPIINPSLPQVGSPNSTEEPKIVTDISQILGLVNGGLDNANIAAAAGIVDTKLASPTGAVWRTIHESPFSFSNPAVAAGTYFFQSDGVAKVGGANTPNAAFIFVDPAAYAVTGKTSQLRLYVSGMSGVALGTTPTFGLYPIASLIGASGSVGVSLTTVVTGSTVAVAPVVNAGSTPGVSSSFAVPNNGFAHIFGAVLPGATLNNSCFTGNIRLELSYT